MQLVCHRGLAALLCTLAGACSAPSQPAKLGSQPSWRTPEVSGQTASPPRNKVIPTVFAPSGPAAAHYNDAPPPAAKSPLGDAITAAIHGHCRTAGVAPPVPDGRLDRAAAELIRVLPENAPPAYPVVEFALQRHGIIEPSPHLVPVVGSFDDPESIVERLGEVLPAILTGDRITRYGMGMVRGPEGAGQDELLLVLQASHVETKPIPRESAGVVLIEGRATGDYRDPDVFITREDGSVDQKSVRRSGDQGFRAELACRGRRGRQQVEITAQNAAGSTVLANFPVWCNDSSPESIAITSSVDDSAVATTANEAEALMLTLVNRDRKAHGLLPLELSPELSNAARAHSEDMRVNDFVGHVSPTTGNAEDRVHRAGIRTALVMENVAKAYGVAEAQRALMNSPAHRANLLAPNATHIGIGIVFDDQLPERRVMLFTQLFMRVPPPIDAAATARLISAKIAAARSELTHDAELSAVAQSYAENVMAPGRSEKTAAAWRAKQFETLRARFAQVGTVVVTVDDVEPLDVTQAVDDAWVTHYGIGVAQGPHEEFGDRAIFVVLFLGKSY